jgi:hypothetical protein
VLGSILTLNGEQELNVGLIIVEESGKLSWSGPAQGNKSLSIPQGSALTIRTGGQFVNEVQNCSAAQRFIIGTCIYATCGGGGGAVYTFAEVQSSGGTVNVSAGSNSPVCLNATINLTATPGGALTGTPTYAWSGPDGFVSTLQNPSIPNATLAKAGVYSVTITNAVGGCVLTNTSTVNVEVSRINIWTGNVNRLWSVPGNWSCNLVPVYESDVQIPARPNNPILDIDYTVGFNLLMYAEGGFENSLTINPNITLGIQATTNFNDYLVHVLSDATGTGSIGKITGNFVSGDNNFIVERFIPGTKRRWNLLTIPVSNNTATIRDVWGGGSRPRVATSQLVNEPGTFPSPFHTPNPFPGAIGDYVPGDATIITGHRFVDAASANALGFDWWPELIIPGGGFGGNPATSPSSIRPYRHGVTNNTGTGFISRPELHTGFPGGSIVNSTVNSVIPNEQGFMLFTRGDRRVLHDWYNATTLRPFGGLKKFNQTATIQAKGAGTSPVLTLVGNPYPSAVDFDVLRNIGTNATALEERFWVWDSNLPGIQGFGGFRLVTKVGPNWQSVPRETGSTITSGAQIIHSSQAVLVEGTIDGGTLTFTEDAKVTNTAAITPFEVEEGNAGTNPGMLFINLHKNVSGEKQLVDGALTIIGESYQKELKDNNDIQKISNYIGNLSIAFAREGKRLASDAISIPEDNEVLNVDIQGMETGKYILEIHGEQLLAEGRSAFLVDKYLGTETPIQLNGTIYYDYNVTTTDEGSVAPSRFDVVFKQGNVLPVTFTSLRAVEQQKDILVNWSVATENKMSHYEVEHSRNGTDFAKGQQVAALNTSPANYEWLHTQPGAGVHFYRVSAVSLDGRRMLTNVVKVDIGGGKAGVKAYPNVVGNSRQVTLEMNSLVKGTYTLQITDMSGRVIQSQTIKHNGGSAAQVIQLPSTLSTGRYNIKLNGESGSFTEVILKN